MESANQRLLNEASAHINAQGCKSGSTDSCEYEHRFADHPTLHCAFWPAIETYRADMEDSAASDLISCWNDCLFTWASDLDPAFADELQAAHDNAHDDEGNEHFIREFNSALQSIARNHGLEIPPEAEG